jgi:hypothetical protein
MFTQQWRIAGRKACPIERLCGVFSLTDAAKLSLHISHLPERSALAHLVHKSSEFEQIRYTEQRTLLAEDDLRVGGGQIRPLQRNGANRDVVDPEQEPSSVTVVSLAHASQLFAAKRMERVRDAHKAHPCA